MVLSMKLGHFQRTCAIARAVLLPTQFRSLFFKPETYTSSEPYRVRSYWKSAFLISCLLYITAWNLRTTDFNRRDDYFPTTLNKYGFMFRLDQYWSMFAPYPLEDDGWFVVSGKTKSEQRVNLLVP